MCSTNAGQQNGKGLARVHRNMVVRPRHPDSGAITKCREGELTPTVGETGPCEEWIRRFNDSSPGAFSCSPHVHGAGFYLLKCSPSDHQRQGANDAERRRDHDHARLGPPRCLVRVLGLLGAHSQSVAPLGRRDLLVHQNDLTAVGEGRQGTWCLLLDGTPRPLACAVHFIRNAIYASTGVGGAGRPVRTTGPCRGPPVLV